MTTYSFLNTPITSLEEFDILSNEIEWKPSEEQRLFLDSHYRLNGNLSRKKASHIASDFNVKFLTSLTAEHILAWFEEERSNSTKETHESEKISKLYHKFTKKEKELLHAHFEKEKYPSFNEMIKIAQELGTKVIKIENWFKHTRRHLAKKGQFVLQERRQFTEDQLTYAQKRFQENSKPKGHEFEDMANDLDCEVEQIVKWFANRRLKQKRGDSKGFILKKIFREDEGKNYTDYNTVSFQTQPHLTQQEPKLIPQDKNINPSIQIIQNQPVYNQPLPFNYFQQPYIIVQNPNENYFPLQQTQPIGSAGAQGFPIYNIPFSNYVPYMQNPIYIMAVNQPMPFNNWQANTGFGAYDTSSQKETISQAASNDLNTDNNLLH